MDDDHEVEEGSAAVLDQQGYVLDHHGVIRSGLEELERAGTDQWMRDGVELLALLVIDKGLGGQGCPVKTPVRRQDVVSEGGDQLRQPVGARSHHLAGDHVGVDDVCTAIDESARHR